MDSAQVRLECCHGLTFTDNSIFSPQYGLVLRNLKNSVVKDNSLHIGALTQLILDLGEHEEGAIVADNPGSLYTDLDKAIWSSAQR